MLIYSHSVDIGTKVSFKTHNQIDRQTYRGTIRGFTSIAGAKVYEDLAAIQQSMPSEVAAVSLNGQTFVLVETEDKVLRPFAIAWIDGDTFTIEDNSIDRLIVVRDVPAENLDMVLNTIRTLGYDCSIYRA